MPKTVKKEDPTKHMFDNGRAWFSTIKELVEKMDAVGQSDYEGEESEDDVRREIEEGPLSVQVRDGWHSPGAPSQGAEEYEILLSTGGPALRIYGKLGQYNEPDSADLEAQDWFIPWTRVPDVDEDVLLKYVRCFYFGE